MDADIYFKHLFHLVLYPRVPSGKFLTPLPASLSYARCWEYNGEQERPRPLFPLILQPSGWSPQPTALPGRYPDPL